MGPIGPNFRLATSLSRAGPADKGQADKGIFDPGNLQDLGSGQEGKAEGPAKSPGAEQYKSVFDPKNLQQLGPEGEKKQDGATQ